MKRLYCFLLIIWLAMWPTFAESTWEGTTAVSRFGEFPESGNYGASNSFAINTAVTVKNLDTGMETTVIITERLADPGLFLLISKDAGRELGVSQGEIVRVRASIAQPEGAITAFPDDLPYNPDPDVNPAASVTSFPESLELEPTREETAEVVETEETTETEDTVGPVEPEETEVAESTSDEGGETADETTEPEIVEVAETPPRINGVDVAEQPLEEEAPSQAADEPSVPAEEIDSAEVSALESASDVLDEQPRLIVEAPPEPPVEQDAVPTVLGLNPAPVLDQTETFVLLAEPDVPDASELVRSREPELEEALRISSLEEPEVTADEELGLIIPPEPVFEERIVETDEPVAEDILIVSNLNEPDALAMTPYDMPAVADEPSVPAVEKETPIVSALETAEAAGEPVTAIAADTPDVVDDVETEVAGMRYSLLDEPEEPALDDEMLAAVDEPAYGAPRITLLDSAEETEDEAVAEYSMDEPLFVADEEPPELPEDILIVSDLKVPVEPDEETVRIAGEDREEPAVAEVEEDVPVVVNGFAPPEYDPDEIEIVLEPAEPKPPEPRIAGSDLLETAEGEEPATDVEVARLTEPEVEEEKAVVAVEEEKPEPDTGRVTDTKIASAEEVPPVRIETGEVAEPEVTKAGEKAPAEELEYTTELAVEKHYLQLAAFTEARTAAKLRADLAETYPVTVYLTEGTDRRVYKVLVGPLNQDESGALLYQFRVRGFPDAFVRAGAVN